MLEAATGKCKIKGHTYTKYGQKELYKRNKIRYKELDLHKSCPPIVGTWKLSVGPLPSGSNPADRGCAEQSGTISYVHQDWQRTSNVTAMKEALCWLPLQNRRLVKRLTFMHKTKHGQHGYMLPPCVNQPKRQNRTHYKYPYNLIRTQTDGYLYSYLPKTIKAWNSLPSNISNRIDIDSFRTSLLNDMRNGNVQVVHRSITTNQARGGSGATTFF